MMDESASLAQIYPGISVATHRDLNFVLHLQRKFSNQLGFLPKPAIEWYVENARVLLARENGEPAGYVLGRASMRFDRRICPLTQTAVSLDLQRSRVGTLLIAAATFRAKACGAEMLQAWCREDIPANAFWHACGFQRCMTRDPENARQKLMILWRRPLTDGAASRLLIPPPVAGWRAKKAGEQQLMFDVSRSALIG